MKIIHASRLTIAVDNEDAGDAAAAAAVLLPWRLGVFRPTFALASASEESTSLDAEAVFVVLASLGLEDATVARRDFVSC